MQQYEQYKDSGIDWIGQIPAHWEVKRLKNLFSYGKGLNITKENLQDTGVSVINYGQVHSKLNLGTGVNENIIKYVSKDYLMSDKKSLVRCNDFIFADTSEDILGVGNCAFIDIESEIFAGYHTIVLKAITDEPKKYLAYLFLTDMWRSQLRSKVAGIKVYSVTKSILNTTTVILPPLAEQKAIANFLDTKCEQIDRAVAQKEKVVELLNERRQILIQRAVTRGLNPDVELRDSGIDWIGQIPAHWEVKRLKNVISQLIIKEQSINSSLMYIGMENIESWTGKYILTESTVEGLANRFYKGNILFGKLRPYLAKVFLAENEGICSTEFMVFDARENNENYIQKLLISSDFISIVNASTYGSKMPRASVEFINNTFLPLPPLAEQTAIAEYLDNVNEKIDRAIVLKREEIEKLKEYKQTLINSAVTGKIKIA